MITIYGPAILTIEEIGGRRTDVTVRQNAVCMVPEEKRIVYIKYE